MSPDPPTSENRERQRELDRATRVAAGSFLVAILAGIGLIAVYFAGGQTQAEGVLLFVAFLGVAIGLVVWTKVLIDEPEMVEQRPLLRSAAADRAEFAETYEGARTASTPDPAAASRRSFLGKLLAGAGASLVLALLLPFRSLGPSPQNELFETGWRDGIRLVDFSGRPIRPAEVAIGQVVTVFPDNLVGDADSQALLIGVDATDLDLPEGSPETVQGFVCYSKVCTHAGCPVGLYRAQVGQLLCPCHQSTFDVWRGAQPVSGPATRPLPQLPLATDDFGFFIARGEFEEPVGAGFWNMDRA